MNKTIPFYFFILFLVAFLIVPEHLCAQLIRYDTKDSLNGKPKISSFLMGRLKLNGIYDITGNLYGNSSFLIHENDVFGRNRPGIRMDMRQSQVRFSTVTQLSNGKEIKALLEADFEGGVNQASLFRLRHAWIQYDHLMIGQGWSTFGDASLWPASLLDWDGPTGMVLSRRLVIRYSNRFKYKGHAGYELALEQMEPRRSYDYTTSLDYGVEFAPRRIPDVIGALRYDYDNGSFLKVAGIYRNIAYDSKNRNQPTSTYSSTAVSGWGVTAIMNLYFNKKSGLTNNLIAQFNLGKGISDYLLAVGGSGLDGFANADKTGHLDLLSLNCGFISYQRYWTSKFHTMVVGSYNHFSGGKGTVNVWDKMTNYYLTLNVSYDFLSNLMMGIETQYGYKDLILQDGSNAGKAASRINFGMLYNF
jgi:hypothetical protein